MFSWEFLKNFRSSFSEENLREDDTHFSVKATGQKGFVWKKNVFQMTFFRKVSDTFAIVLGPVENKKH